MASNFGLTVSSPQVNIIQSLNYLLATQANAASSVVNYNGNVLVANTATGSITSVYANGAAQTGTISYLYGYVDVKYANSATGSSGFTSNSAYANYYGVYTNKTGIESSNPADYQWTQVSGGFGNTKTLWYTTGGGNTINFFVGNAAPNIYYEPVIDNLPILLAIVANSTVVTNSIQPAAITNVQVAGNTITGYNIQLGTITANLIAANTIFVNQSLQSSNATFDSPTSNGFWLDASNGSARFGGNMSIGNNLTVGGLITASALNTNTVSTTNIVTQSVSQGNAASSTTQITVTTPPTNQVNFYTYSNVTVNVGSVTGVSNYISGVLATDIEFDYTGGGSTQTWILTFWLYKNNSSIIAQTFRYDVDTANQSRFNNIVPFSYLDTSVGANTNYTYAIGVSVNPGGTSVPQIILDSGSIICQILKR